MFVSLFLSLHAFQIVPDHAVIALSPSYELIIRLLGIFVTAPPSERQIHLLSFMCLADQLFSRADHRATQCAAHVQDIWVWQFCSQLADLCALTAASLGHVVTHMRIPTTRQAGTGGIRIGLVDVP
jgi:hypothetical protein